MNKTCLPLTEENYKTIIECIRNGFEYENVRTQPNERVALILMCIAITGLRVSDVLLLKLNSVVRQDDTLYFNISEKKTKKRRSFRFNSDLYMVLQDYCIRNNIAKDELIFPIKERQVFRVLQRVCRYLNLDDCAIGSHSFRKMFCMKTYEQSGQDLLVVQTLLQHSSLNITRRYLTIPNAKIESALEATGSFLL